MTYGSPEIKLINMLKMGQENSELKLIEVKFRIKECYIGMWHLAINKRYKKRKKAKSKFTNHLFSLIL